MNLAEYLARRAAQAPAPSTRPLCARCRRPLPTCYCAHLRPFTAPVRFVILQHPLEARNGIATARMAHLSVVNSRLIVGKEFDGDPRVQALLAEPGSRHLLLFPGTGARALPEVLAETPAAELHGLVLWVLDAKWQQVPQMLRLSPRIRALPRVMFHPESPSAFQIRRQPDSFCLSTIEALHAVIGLVRRRQSSDDTAHAALLDVFRHFVSQQQDFARPGRPSRHWLAKAARAARRHARPPV